MYCATVICGYMEVVSLLGTPVIVFVDLPSNVCIIYYAIVVWRLLWLCLDCIDMVQVLLHVL